MKRLESVNNLLLKAEQLLKAEFEIAKGERQHSLAMLKERTYDLRVDISILSFHKKKIVRGGHTLSEPVRSIDTVPGMNIDDC